jgi:hypothetical protein
MKRTEQLDLEAHAARVAKKMREKAAKGLFLGNFDSEKQLLYIRKCTRSDPASGAKLIFSRDGGHHSSGWFKNPDYERCLHLSISPLHVTGLVDVRGAPLRELDREMNRLWVNAFFGGHIDKVWAESPKSAIGKSAQVWHWRLFCDSKWEPILPRKEVYSREFIELGWRSASQVLEEDGVEIVSSLYPG